MDRKDFLRKMGLGVIVTTTVPTALMASENKTKGEKSVGVAIDIKSISGIPISGRKSTPAEILELWKQTGILIYDSDRGNAPVLLSGEIKTIDLGSK